MKIIRGLLALWKTYQIGEAYIDRYGMCPSRRFRQIALEKSLLKYKADYYKTDGIFIIRLGGTYEVVMMRD